MRDAVQVFRDFLRGRGLRCTGERDEIIRALAETKGHFRVEGLVKGLLERGAVASRATVYRTIPLLVDSGMVRIAESSTAGDQAYEFIYGRDHHDHLYCLRCGEHVEFEERGIELLQMDVARHYGYKLIGHRMELEGVCPKCQVHETGEGKA